MRERLNTRLTSAGVERCAASTSQTARLFAIAGMSIADAVKVPRVAKVTRERARARTVR